MGLRWSLPTEGETNMWRIELRTHWLERLLFRAGDWQSTGVLYQDRWSAENAAPMMREYRIAQVPPEPPPHTVPPHTKVWFD